MAPRFRDFDKTKKFEGPLSLKKVVFQQCLSVVCRLDRSVGLNYDWTDSDDT